MYECWIKKTEVSENILNPSVNANKTQVKMKSIGIGWGILENTLDRKDTKDFIQENMSNFLAFTKRTVILRCCLHCTFPNKSTVNNSNL